MGLFDKTGCAWPWGCCLRTLCCHAATPPPTSALSCRYGRLLIFKRAHVVGWHDIHDCGRGSQFCSLRLCTSHPRHPSGCTQHHCQVGGWELALQLVTSCCAWGWCVQLTMLPLTKHAQALLHSAPQLGMPPLRPPLPVAPNHPHYQPTNHQPTPNRRPTAAPSWRTSCSTSGSTCTACWAAGCASWAPSPSSCTRPPSARCTRWWRCGSWPSSQVGRCSGGMDVASMGSHHSAGCAARGREGAGARVMAGMARLVFGW